MMLVGLVGLIILGLVVFGWWTIGFPRRRIWGGLIMLGVAFTCFPFLLVLSGERFGFHGIIAGLVGLFCIVAGGFFFLVLGWMGRPQKIRKVRTLSEDPDLF
ncbi:hypothetical protein [Exiguobacterium sp. SL-9]|uniref:hypothetical protein n=1 Tax=Exiguobacterium sp. SL-9 TaxID=2510963 RepID=UPI00103A8F74|nr:hypothetical protein [Exiguobacterium sp. SL-9]TCI21349.1 hypothetical protein EVJ34_08750 [Exiguobacterium sp. SL-9]